MDENLLNKSWNAQTFMISPDMTKFFILKYNFTLKDKGNPDIVDFYFFPLVTSERGLMVRDESVEYTRDIAPTLLPASLLCMAIRYSFISTESSPNLGDMKFNRMVPNLIMN